MSDKTNNNNSVINVVSEKDNEEIEVKYHQLCDKYGFCILKIIPTIPTIKKDDIKEDNINMNNNIIEISKKEIMQPNIQQVTQIAKNKVKSFKGRTKK